MIAPKLTGTFIRPKLRYETVENESIVIDIYEIFN